MGKDDEDYTRVLVELTNLLGEPIDRTRGAPSDLKPGIPHRIDVSAIRQKTGFPNPPSQPA